MVKVYEQGPKVIPYLNFKMSTFKLKEKKTRTTKLIADQIRQIF